MVKRDDYNYQESRRKMAVLEHEVSVLKLMCVALNKESRALRLENARTQARFKKLLTEAGLDDVKEEEYRPQAQQQPKKQQPLPQKQQQQTVHIVGGGGRKKQQQQMYDGGEIEIKLNRS